jgi:DNA ligase-1
MNTYPPWAMLATNYNPATVLFPCLVQFKLNGERAKWSKTDKVFISRSGKVIPKVCIPHLYDKMALFPNTDYDGELYCHGMALQDIKGILTQSRRTTSPDAGKLDYYVFDIIADNYAMRRLHHHAYLSYQPHPPFWLVQNQTELDYKLAQAITAGFEGLMIRTLSGFYVAGRSWNLMKLKPLHRATVTITGVNEGYEKYNNSLGSFDVAFGNVKFKVGGGRITTAMRDEIWTNRTEYPGRSLVIEYRELTKSGIPAQAQIIEIK